MDYAVSAHGGGAPGELLPVKIEWHVPNCFGGLLNLFGAHVDDFSGHAVAYFRQEG